MTVLSVWKARCVRLACIACYLVRQPDNWSNVWAGDAQCISLWRRIDSGFCIGHPAKRLDELLARLDVQMSFETVVASRNNTGEAGGRDEADIRKNLLESLRKLPATGRVLLHLEPSIGSIEAFPDFPLEDGDRLYFPPVTKTINVVGAVLKEMPLSYQPGLGLSGYLDVGRHDQRGLIRAPFTSSVQMVRYGAVASHSGHYRRSASCLVTPLSCRMKLTAPCGANSCATGAQIFTSSGSASLPSMP